jgi:hypothetical protein
MCLPSRSKSAIQGEGPGEFPVALTNRTDMSFGLAEADEVRIPAAEPAERPLGGRSVGSKNIDGDDVHLAMI